MTKPVLSTLLKNRNWRFSKNENRPTLVQTHQTLTMEWFQPYTQKVDTGYNK
jgi:hypothetical protein